MGEHTRLATKAPETKQANVVSQTRETKRSQPMNSPRPLTASYSFKELWGTKMKSANSEISEIYSKIHNELSSGLLYTHTRINDNTRKSLGSTSFLYALIELLNEKGLISIEELDERKKQVAERLVRKFTESGTECGRGAHPLGVWLA